MNRLNILVIDSDVVIVVFISVYFCTVLQHSMGGGAVDISQFQYNPPRSMLMPPPVHAGRQQTFTPYHKVYHCNQNQPATAITSRLQGHQQGSFQTDDIITDDVLLEFANEVDLTQGEEYNDDFADMEAFLVDFEQENLPEEYADAFVEPLEIEDIQGFTEGTSHTSWPQHYQSRVSPAATRGTPRQPGGVRPELRPIRAPQPTSSQTLRAQRPSGMQVTQGRRPPVSTKQGQGVVRPPMNNTTQTTLTRWLQNGHKNTLLPRTQINQCQTPAVGHTQTTMRPPLPQTSQNQWSVRPVGVMTNQSQRTLRPAGVATSQNQRSVRPTRGMTNQSQRFPRPVEIMANQNRQPLRPIGVITNQNPQPLRQRGPMTSQNVQSFRPAATIPRGNMLPLRPAGTVASQNTQPFRALTPQASQTPRPINTTASQIVQRHGPVQNMTNTYGARPPPHTQQITQLVQGDQQHFGGPSYAPMYLATSSQRPHQIQAPQGQVSHTSPPDRQVPQTIYQQIRPRFVQAGQLKDSTGPMGWQGTQADHFLSVEGARQWPEGGNLEQEQPHSALQSCSSAPLPPGSVMTVTRTHTLGAAWQQQHQHNQQQEHYHHQHQPSAGVPWNSHSMEAPPQVVQMGSSGLKQFYQLASGMEGSSISQPPPAPHNDLPAPHTTATDKVFTSLESEYQNSVASTRSRYHYSSNITQFQPLSESPAEQSHNGARHARPVAGVKPMVSDAVANRNKGPDPFSHLAKEWNEMQRGKCKGKLSNIYLPTPSPRPLEKDKAPTPTATRTPGKNNDWRDLEMFQWCRQKEKLALHSLYQREAQPETQYSPKDMLSKDHPVTTQTPLAQHRLPQTSNLQITYDNGSQGPVVGVGLSGVGSARQNININLSSLDEGAAPNSQVSLTLPAASRVENHLAGWPVR